MNTVSSNRMALVNLILRAVAVAMGVGAWVLNLLGVVTLETSVSLLGIGLTALAIAALNARSE